jgi:5,10-methylenetetrahydromethanopterin reductase
MIAEAYPAGGIPAPYNGSLTDRRFGNQKRTSMHRVSIALQGNKSFQDYGTLAELVESLGFDMLSVYADLGFQPAIGPLIAAALHTKRIALGPAALNPYLLHPVEIAGQIAHLDQVSGGRAYLGLARGAWLDSLGIEDRTPLRRLRETVDIVSHLLAGRTTGYAGEIFKLPEGRLFQYPVERAAVPLLIGTWGPKLLQYAGEVAEEVKIGGSTNPALVQEVRRNLAIGEQRAGRETGSTGIVFGAVTVVDENGEAARAYVRKEAARYLPVVAPLDPTVDVPAEHLKEMGRLVDDGREDDAAALVPDDLLDRFAFSGSPEQITRQSQALIDAGVTRIEFGTPHGFNDAAGIRLLGERVLPALR